MVRILGLQLLQKSLDFIQLDLNLRNPLQLHLLLAFEFVEADAQIGEFGADCGRPSDIRRILGVRGK